MHTRRTLLTQVWGGAGDAWFSERTVDVHVTRLRGKLGRQATRLQTVRGIGYRWARATSPDRS